MNLDYEGNDIPVQFQIFNINYSCLYFGVVKYTLFRL